MSDDYKVQLSVKAGQDMVNVRANTADELQGIIDDMKTRTDLSRFFPKQGLVYGVAEVTERRGQTIVTDVTDESKPPSDIEALAAIERNLGAAQVDPATPAQVLVLKKRGMDEAEAKALSKTEASKRIKEGK